MSDELATSVLINRTTKTVSDLYLEAFRNSLRVDHVNGAPVEGPFDNEYDPGTQFFEVGLLVWYRQRQYWKIACYEDASSLVLASLINFGLKYVAYHAPGELKVGEWEDSTSGRSTSMVLSMSGDHDELSLSATTERALETGSWLEAQQGRA